MQNFCEIRFPEDISYGTSGGPQFRTHVVNMAAGQEQRVKIWEYARAKYNVSYNFKNRQQMENILSFFNVARGRATGFRFKDHADFWAMNQEIGEGDGKKKEFQLIKKYQIGNSSYQRIIKKPVAGTIKVYVNNLEVPFKCNFETGIITLDKPASLGEKVSAGFEFDVPVRFDSDELRINQVSDDVFSVDELSLIEVNI